MFPYSILTVTMLTVAITAMHSFFPMDQINVQASQITSDDGQDRRAPTREAVIEYYENIFVNGAVEQINCDRFDPNSAYWGDDGDRPRTYNLQWQYDFERDQPARQTVLYEFICTAGAYNVSFVYIAYQDGYLQPVSFAQPSFNVIQTDPEDFESAVERIDLTGFAATHILVNPRMDAQKGTIRSRSNWRGIGDAYSSGLWRFEQGNFVLKRYEVDASYDLETQPQLIVEY